MLLGYVGQKAMNKQLDLQESQEVLMILSDIIIEIYSLESVMLRTERPLANNIEHAIKKVLFHDGANRIHKLALDLTGAVVDESMYAAFIVGIRKLSKYKLQNTMQLRREIADNLIANNSYLV